MANGETKHLDHIHNWPNARVCPEAKPSYQHVVYFAISWFQITWLAGCTRHHGYVCVHGQSPAKCGQILITLTADFNNVFLNQNVHLTLNLHITHQCHKKHRWTCYLSDLLLWIQVNGDNLAGGRSRLCHDWVWSRPAEAAGSVVTAWSLVPMPWYETYSW